ncbi:MAG: hypothetical protein E5V49_16855 [Mesorhizobium sp.]|nr:MAG: hypothetical protein E5V48_16480 [Mesorhizobium sp.]TJW31361.1 MAG: hypothetical protein E5V49_16855 [Mesorhizobium sp.]
MKIIQKGFDNRYVQQRYWLLEITLHGSVAFPTAFVQTLEDTQVEYDVVAQFEVTDEFAFVSYHFHTPRAATGYFKSSALHSIPVAHNFAVERW